MGRSRPSTYIDASTLDPHATPPQMMGFKARVSGHQSWVVVDFRKRRKSGLCLIRLSVEAGKRIGFPGAVFCLRSYMPDFWRQTMWGELISQKMSWYQIQGGEGPDAQSRTVLLCGIRGMEQHGNWLVRPDEVEIWGNAIGCIEHFSKNHRTWKGVVRDFVLDPEQRVNPSPRASARHGNITSWREVAK